jgi:hypothetical protein
MRVPRFLLAWQWMKRLRKEALSTKPSSAIHHPPAKYEQRQGERQVPPQWKKDAHHNAKDGEQKPEDFLFHETNKLYH